MSCPNNPTYSVQSKFDLSNFTINSKNLRIDPSNLIINRDNLAIDRGNLSIEETY